MENLQTTWESLCDEAGSDEACIDLQCAFLEQYAITAPSAVLELANTPLQRATDLAYVRGIAYAKAMQGYARFMLSDYAEALRIFHEILEIIKKEDLEDVESRVYGAIANVHINLGNFNTALNFGYKAMLLIQHTGDRVHEAWTLYGFGTGFFDMGVIDEAQSYFEKSLALFREEDIAVGEARALSGIGSVLQQRGLHDEALPYHQNSLELFRQADNSIGEARALNDIGCVCLQRGDIRQARELLAASLRIREATGNRQAQITSWMNLGNVSLAEHQPDEAIDQYRKALQIAGDVSATPRQYQLHELLCRAFEEKGDAKSALDHYKTFHEIKERLFNDRTELRISTMQAAFETEKAEKDALIERLKNVELREKNERLESLLEDLKTAQAQLVQSEKMASLGQVTAGIAHEIKNPLNFVNNFAMLSLELMTELEDLLETHRTKTVKDVIELGTDLLHDLKFNATKIREHGERADLIIRSMLEHAGGKAGELQPVSVNSLLHEYTKLAYHGMRALDSSFNVSLEEHYAPSLPDIRAQPHMLGRVFLNVLNNAFYAVREKKERSADDYAPKVVISTTEEHDMIAVRIADNGVGIPEDIRKNIFDPFFTTKPSGSGTGLGLSLSYDIVVHAHGGRIEVESSKGEGTCFTIYLTRSNE